MIHHWLSGLLCACALSQLTACTPASVPHTSGEAIRLASQPQLRSDTTGAITVILSDLSRLAPAGADVWPGFRLEDQVFLLFTEQGPTGLVGDPTPPEDFRPAPGFPGVYLRPGPPPDSLTVQGIIAWHGRPAAAVPMPFRYASTSGLNGYGYIHEAFHAFQNRVRPQGRFAWGGNSNATFPDTVVDAVALLNLEGRLLAEALGATSERAMRDAARSLLEVRSRRCERVGVRECELERTLEQIEGSATFAEWRVLRNAGRVSSAAVVERLQQEVQSVEDLKRLERFYFYDRGHGLLLLIERLGVPEWRQQAERLPPDSVLALHVDFSAERASGRVSSILSSEAAALAKVDAERSVAAMRELREGIVRDFWAQPGVTARIYSRSGNVSRLAVSGEARSTTVTAGRRNNLYIVGQESRWIGRDSEWEARSTSGILSFGGGPLSVTVKTAVAGHPAQVDGKAIVLDAPGERVQGVITLALPNLNLQAARGEIQAYGDSVSVWLP